jgi:iron complex outermembrane receptor protein
MVDTQIFERWFSSIFRCFKRTWLLQTPPLDLKQVEIIKGSASTLYGGGAIAGLVNLVSKTPTEERELRLLINGTSAGGLDINGFYSQRFDKIDSRFVFLTIEMQPTILPIIN